MGLAWTENSHFGFGSFRKFWSVICERLVGFVSFETNVSKTAGQIGFHEIELAYRDDLSLDWAIMFDVKGIKHVYKWNESHNVWKSNVFKTRNARCVLCLKINVICTVQDIKQINLNTALNNNMYNYLCS